MVSVVNPRQADASDDLLHVDSPPLHRRRSEAEFSDRLLLTDSPSLTRRISRGLVRFLVVFLFGVAATLAWQSYGDLTRQSITTFAAERGWPTDWLSYGQAAKGDSSPRAGMSETPAAQARAEGTPAADTDLQELKTMTLGLAATVNTMRARLDQLALGQEQSAGDIAKLQAAEQDLRQKVSAAGQRAAPAPASKQVTPPPPPRTPAPPR